MRALPHPPEAENDEDSLEMLRGWIVDGQLQVALAAWVWDDEPAEWGRLLAESACHLADAISKETGKDRNDLFRTISESVIHHLKNPPADLEGEHLE
ncbi:MAG: DUF5076 domain-containing protein [Verrucomicrobia bacterium]|nr:DUF5076 domain-containing protein [Verrucomicrobiota bacterium]